MALGKTEKRGGGGGGVPLMGAPPPQHSSRTPVGETPAHLFTLSPVCT